MKRIIVFFLVISLMLGFSGCGKPSVSVTITSGKVVENFTTGLNVFLQSDLGTANAMVGDNGMLYTFPEKEIIRIELDCTFIGVGENLKVGSDEHLKEVYKVVRDSATFTINNETVDNIWGYWPQKAGKNSAEEMSLFYLIPEGQSLEDLKFVISGNKLGDDTFSLEYTDFTR